jgi:hypothetical protein
MVFDIDEVLIGEDGEEKLVVIFEVGEAEEGGGEV